MAKKRSRGNQQFQVGQQQSKPADKGRPIDAEAERIKAEHAARALDVPTTPSVSPGVVSTPEEYAQAVNSFTAAIAIYENIKLKYQEKAKQVSEREEEVERSQQKLNESVLAHEGTVHGFTEQTVEIQERREKLEELSAVLAAQQAEAEGGFLTRRAEILDHLPARIAEITASAIERELVAGSNFESKLQAISDARSEEHARKIQELLTERAVLDAERIELQNESARLERRSAEFTFKQELAAEDEEELRIGRDSEMERSRNKNKQIVQDLEERNEQLLKRIEDIEPRALTLDKLNKEIGADASQILEDRDRFEREIRILKAELAIRPTTDVREALDFTKQELQEAINDRNVSNRRERELESQLEYQNGALAGVEYLELAKDGLEQTIGAYQATVRDLSAHLGQLRDDREVDSAFPECTRMDENHGAKAQAHTSSVPDLEELIEDLQIRMANDPDAEAQNKQLNYRLSDLRIFLAGLAMSKLHLLEGTSGTGKTTLPHAFANALGGFPRKVEVQAGWRDKQDLLGYYNSFERIYRETPCLQYLYGAGLEYCSDQVIFIILDEMNLSHPEQYFADLLSALEDPKPEKLISISDRNLPNVPKRMKTKAGVQLVLPPNVWFIGTANQDETTFAFAPKTYDRAHVMELQPNAPVVQRTEIQERHPVSVRSLSEAFRSAEERYTQQTQQANTFFNILAPYFRDKFQIGWGNRLNEHTSKFVSANIAAGGSIGEAVDHLLSSKVLRKIQGRHSVRPDSLDGLSRLIKDQWIDRENAPERSLHAIQTEIEFLQIG